MKKNVLKKIIAGIAVIALFFCASGCSFSLRTVDNLMIAPVSNVKVEKYISDNKIFDRYDERISIITPQMETGDTDGIEYYSSLYNQCDADNDGENNEFITFYANSKESDIINMVIIKDGIQGMSHVAETFVATSIESLAITNISLSDEKQIVVTMSYHEQSFVCVFSCGINKRTGDFTLKNLTDNSSVVGKYPKLPDNLSYNISQMKYEEMMIFNVDNTLSKKAMLLVDYGENFTTVGKVYRVDNNGILSSDKREIMLPSRATGVTGCKISDAYKSFNIPFVLYFDYSYNSGAAGAKMYDTVVYFWSNDNLVKSLYRGSLCQQNFNALPQSHLYYDTKLSGLDMANNTSERNDNSTCEDVNKDGIIEIPFSHDFADVAGGEKNKASFTFWYQVSFDDKGNITLSVVDECRVYFDANNFFRYNGLDPLSTLYIFSEDNKNFDIYEGSVEYGILNSGNPKTAEVRRRETENIDEYIRTSGNKKLGECIDDKYTFVYSIINKDLLSENNFTHYNRNSGGSK